MQALTQQSLHCSKKLDSSLTDGFRCQANVINSKASTYDTQILYEIILKNNPYDVLEHTINRNTKDSNDQKDLRQNIFCERF